MVGLMTRPVSSSGELDRSEEVDAFEDEGQNNT
jgi:hypothetical protein